MDKKSLSILAIFVLVFASFAFISISAALPAEKISVIIGFKTSSDAALIRAQGGDITFQYTYVNAIAASLPAKAIAALEKNPNIAYIEEDIQVQAYPGKPNRPTPTPTPTTSPTPTPTPTSTPTPTQTTPWGITKIGAPLVWASNNRGDSIRVAVLDTGIDITHTDLTVLGGANFIRTAKSYNDDNGHGTHCAGIIAALDNSYGVVGVAPEVDLYAVKVLDRRGSGAISGIIAGIEWCITNNMDVLSMSFGSSVPSTTLEAECSIAYQAGLVLVASAGNSYAGTDTVGYPAHYDTVIAVGATDNNDVIASFSSTGPSLSVVAPGVSIYSTYKGNTYATMRGTSMACPHTSGTVALILAEYTNLTPQEVKNQLQDTAYFNSEKMGTEPNDVYGYGRIDASLACTTTPSS